MFYQRNLFKSNSAGQINAIDLSEFIWPIAIIK